MHTNSKLQGVAGMTPTVVLVVEDEILVRMSTAAFLRDCGFKVLEASTADAALDLLQAAPVNVVFSDIMMPGRVDGMGLVRWLKEHRPAIKSIVTSGTREVVAQGARHDVFLPKPYSLADLEACIGKVLAEANSDQL
jgi:CheY-like chemotaxis protein